MPEYDYHVVIRKTGTGNNTEVTGKLTCTFSMYDTKSNIPIPKYISFTIDFNPLTILGDLRCGKRSYQYLNKRVNADKSWKYFLQAYRCEYSFKKPLYIGNDEQYLKFVSNLDKIMRNNQCRTLEELKKIQKQYKLNLDYNILVEENDISFDLLQRKKRNVTKMTYKSLEYKFGETNEELEKSTYLNKNHEFSYDCHTMADVIFSILHFIVIHKYEFKSCALYQKRYVKIPNHGQGKYCPRKSPLGLNPYFDTNMEKKFIDLDCQESMKKFHEIIRNMKKNKLTYCYEDEQKYRFENEFYKYNDKVKNAPTVNNLIELHSFVKNINLTHK